MKESIWERFSRWIAYQLPKRVVYWACLKYMARADNPSSSWIDAVKANKD